MGVLYHSPLEHGETYHKDHHTPGWMIPVISAGVVLAVVVALAVAGFLLWHFCSAAPPAVALPPQQSRSWRLHHRHRLQQRRMQAA
ncbi:hypothetical protein RIF29_30562 [Crotalaria pallida]|uniref:Uncharacterized protein n=1 Tax=Crotalaria pallida TaxID=3830 RepID=A0AAN9I1B3_CROPI